MMVIWRFLERTFRRRRMRNRREGFAGGERTFEALCCDLVRGRTFIILVFDNFGNDRFTLDA